MAILSTVGNLKTDITEKEGQRIIIKKSSVRGKVIEKEGVVERAYSSFFRVSFDSKIGAETFTYSDLITKAVEVEIHNGSEFVPVIPVTANYRNKTVAIV